MCPVFIKRGNVLFLLKTPADFITKLKSGKILSSDSVLVKNREGLEWIPIQEVSEFQIAEQPVPKSEEKTPGHLSADLFDHIKQPGFNYSALATGAFWYFFHGLPTTGFKRLIPTVVTIMVSGTLGYFLNLPILSLAALASGGWLGSSLFCALRADHDLNRLQVERFHIANGSRAEQSDSIPEEAPPDEDPLMVHYQAWKTKVLN